MTPFFAQLGYHSRTGVEPPGIYNGPGRSEIESADQLVNRTEPIREWLQNEIAWAQEEHQRHANKHRHTLNTAHDRRRGVCRRSALRCRTA